jgi:hypothetical protein
MSTANLLLPIGYDQDIVSDIKPGLVLFFDPEDLKKAGGRCSRKPEFHVREPHLFLCLEAIKDEAFWTPLYTRSSNCRVLLDNDEKRGHSRWLRRTSYANLDEKWVLSTRAVCVAAARSNDKSRKGKRNIYLAASELALGL